LRVVFPKDLFHTVQKPGNSHHPPTPILQNRPDVRYTDFELPQENPSCDSSRPSRGRRCFSGHRSTRPGRRLLGRHHALGKANERVPRGARFRVVHSSEEARGSPCPCFERKSRHGLAVCLAHHSGGTEAARMRHRPQRGRQRRSTFRRKLAGLVGQRGRIAPGPGAALWIPSSKANVTVTGSPPPRPKKAKVRRLVRHLEAELKLKGRPGAGGLPAVGSQRVDFPYTKELAKWSYDEILGIPRTTAVPAASRLF